MDREIIRLQAKVWHENLVRFTLRIPRDLVPGIQALRRRLGIRSMNELFLESMRRLLRDHE